MTSKVKINDNPKLECFIAQFTNINFKLDSGAILENLTIAYKTFGKLNKSFPPNTDSIKTIKRIINEQKR